MEQSEKTQAVAELIKTTYENMGFAILDINPFAPGVFKMEAIDGNGLKEFYVTVLLHMVPVNVVSQCQRPDSPQ